MWSCACVVVAGGRAGARAATWECSGTGATAVASRATPSTRYWESTGTHEKKGERKRVFLKTAIIVCQSNLLISLYFHLFFFGLHWILFWSHFLFLRFWYKTEKTALFKSCAADTRLFSDMFSTEHDIFIHCIFCQLFEFTKIRFVTVTTNWKSCARWSTYRYNTVKHIRK